MSILMKIGSDRATKLVRVITDFSTDRDAKFFFIGTVMWHLSILAIIWSDRKTGNGASNQRLLNESRHKVHV